MRILFKNPLICDGTGNTPYVSDVLIQDGKIEKIGKNLNCQSDLSIDAQNKILSPGFIDTHRHFDFEILRNEDFGKLELAQGITTAVTGNCGLTPYPNSPKNKAELFDFLKPCLGNAYKGYEFETIDEYFLILEKMQHYINSGYLVGTGAVKTCVKGFEKSPFTKKELELASKLLCNSLEAGALGISAGVMYPPECYSTRQEFIDFLKPAAKYNKIMSVHVRGEGNSVVSSVKEICDIAKRSGLRLNISHLKATGKRNWNSKVHEAIEFINEERAKGTQISADVYPYIAGSTTLLTLLPPDFLETETKDTISKLETKKGRDELRVLIQKEYKDWDNMVSSIGWDRVIINGVDTDKNKRVQGKSVTQICSEFGYSDPIDAISELLIEENGNISAILMSMCKEDLDAVIALDYTAIISDSLYSGTENPHPRVYGSFSKTIKEYVVDRKILSVEKAIHKMTYMPAYRYGLDDRGIIKEGKAADLALFELNNIRDFADYSTPKLISKGIDVLLINGELIYTDERYIAKKGEIIKKR